MTSRRLAWTGVGVLAIATLLFAHAGHKAIPTKGVRFGPRTSNLLLEPAARKAMGLSTGNVDFATIEETIRVPAHVELYWGRKGYGSASIAGVVESVRVKPGDFVKAGDTLVEISSMEFDILQLELTHRLLEKRLVEESLKRAQGLGERLVAGKEILQLETEVQDKENSIAILRDKLRAVGLSDDGLKALEDRGEFAKLLPVTAPIAGCIVHVEAAIGAAVAADRHLIEVHDPSTVYVKGEVPESRAAGVKEGMDVRATFSTDPGLVFRGKLGFVGAEISTDSRTLSVWTTLDNSHLALTPGQFGQLEIVIGVSEGVTAAPIQAIVEDGAEKYAIVAVKENTFVRVDAAADLEDYDSSQKPGYVAVSSYAKKNVVLGRSDGKLVEVVDGLYPGDVVVTSGSHELSALFVQGVLKLSDEAKKSIHLSTAEVDLRKVDEVVRLNATLRLTVDREAYASSRILGKILRLYTMPGQSVKRGDVLAEVHSLEFDNLQLDYRAAFLRERLLRSLLEQLQSLAKSGIAPRKDLLQSETEHRTQLSTMLSLARRLTVLGFSEAKLEALGQRGERLAALPISAPIDGKVADVDVVLGQVVKPEDHLFKLADGRLLWAEAEVFEGDFAKVVSGEPKKEVTIRWNGLADREWKGRISFVAPSMDDRERILPIFAELENGDGSLRPGMLGEMLVVVGRPEKEVIAAPNAAFLSVGGQVCAFVESGKTFKRVPVELGRRDAQYAEVIKGLLPGDKVAVSGVNQLNTAIMSLR